MAPLAKAQRRFDSGRPLKHMSQLAAVEYTNSGRGLILDAAVRKHALVPVRRLDSGHSACLIADTPSRERVFVKVKGYEKNPMNRARWRRAARSLRILEKSRAHFVPRLIDAAAFERGDSYWLVTLSAYAGKPVSEGMFFADDDSTIDSDFIDRLCRSIASIRQIPSASVFYAPASVAGCVMQVFGAGAPAWASHWTSAHCDLHWGNVLDGGRYVVDWDMFSLAPAGFDAASILLFSVGVPGLFARLRAALGEMLGSRPARVAIAFAAARMLLMMQTDRYADIRVHERGIRDAVALLLGDAAD